MEPQQNQQPQHPQSKSPFQQFLPCPTVIPENLLLIYVKLTAAPTRPALKDLFKYYRKLLLSGEQTDEYLLIVNYIHYGILAEAILGVPQIRFQALQILKLLKVVKTQPLAHIAKSVKSTDELRNLSELLDMLSGEQLALPELQEFFVIPLVKSYRQGITKIVEEKFSVRWLDTFIEIARSTSNLARVQQILKETERQAIVSLTRQGLKHIGVLRRDIITQLYLILLALQKDEPEPEEILRKIHYFHAKSVIYNTHVLSQLLKYTSITETQTKYHLLFTLPFSLEKQYAEFPNRDEVFNRVVQLYEVGRLGYGQLEQMIKLIVKAQGKWKIDGYQSRKFFVAKCIIKAKEGDAHEILQQWPNLLQEGINCSGNINTPFAIDCIELLLEYFYKKSQQNPQIWLKMWLNPYFHYLEEGNRLTLRGIIEYINPIICRISKHPILLQQLLKKSQLAQHSDQNIELAIISMLQCYRQSQQIQPKESGLYEFVSEPSINLPSNKLATMIESNSEPIALKAFEFVTLSQKLSQPVLPFEYKLVEGFYKSALNTSATDYRRNYITVTKKFFERLRIVYDRELTGKKPKKQKGKQPKQTEYFQEFKVFIANLADQCFKTLYPEMPFELANPPLQILRLILSFFGVYDHQIRKGTTFKGCDILRNSPSPFTEPNFFALCQCLQSSFQNIRTLGYNVITLFPKDFQFNLEGLWGECLSLTNSLIIRQFESGCRLLCFLFERYWERLPVPKLYKLAELNLFQYLLEIIKKRYEIFHKDFETQSQGYYQNLIHGLWTFLAYLLEDLGKNIQSNQAKYKPYADQIRKILQQIFAVLQNVIAFAVEVSCANVSTVVLDSSQSPLKSTATGSLKVDCRGHFIQDSNTLANVQKILSGNTLMTTVDEAESESALENTLVVSFYLLTRESGLLFQSIASLVKSSSLLYAPTASITSTINSFFYALVNLKHMGSVDRIAKGLESMSKALYMKQERELAELPEILMKRLLELLEESKFKNILRRSAGIPYAFTCLLKSEALKRKQLVTDTMKKLFSFARNDDPAAAQLRIHSFNILKRLFQDADLKFELDPFVSEAFALSIKAFGTQEWGVRNSSLMLFSALTLRTLGPKPDLNLLQFFQKCPSLINYFMQQLTSYIKVKTMYPPLYPIALLLSKLTPIEQHLTIKDTHEQSSRLLRKEELQKFIPLLVEAGNTPNYMGRVIIGKALLPFLQLNQIIPFCADLLKKLQPGNSNKVHNELLIVYHLIKSLHKFQTQKQITQTKELTEKQIEFFNILAEHVRNVHKLSRAPLVHQTLLKIAYEFFKTTALLLQNTKQYQDFIKDFTQFAQNYIQKNIYELECFRFKEDLGHSVLRIAVVKLAIGLQSRFTKSAQDINLITSFFTLLAKKSSAKGYFPSIDNELVELYCEQLLFITKANKNTDFILKLKQISGLLTEIAFTSDITPSVEASLLRILKTLKVSLSQTQISYLKAKAMTTTHQPLRISIFKLLSKQKCQIISLMDLFSRPDQLTSFRVSAAKSIQIFDQRLIPAYLRLLQDEDSEIRKFTANQIATLLGLPHPNETILTGMLLGKCSPEQVKTIISEGDLQTKRRNNETARIFSFDKANKYRSDVYSIILLFKKGKLNKQLLENSDGFRIEKTPEIQKLIKDYKEKILQRNEYKFEVILRQLIYDAVVLNQKVDTNHLEPLLQSL